MSVCTEEASLFTSRDEITLGKSFGIMSKRGHKQSSIVTKKNYSLLTFQPQK